jgi:hypothetical protein
MPAASRIVGAMSTFVAMPASRDPGWRCAGHLIANWTWID